MKDRIFYKVMKTLFYIPMCKILFNIEEVGKENIPKDGAFILAGNHTKWLDPPFLVLLNKRQLHFLTKEELFHGILKPFIVGMGCIPVNRKIHDKDALESGYKTLENGNVIAIFPEGTINRTDDIIMPFKIGAVKMSNKTNAPIVPFAITGKYKMFKRKCVRIEYFKPFIAKGDLEKENKKLEKIVSDCLIKYKKETK